RVGARAQGGPDVEAVVVVDHLVLGQAADAGQGAPQGQGVDRARPPGGALQVEDVVVAALDGLEQPERPAAGAGPGGHRPPARALVADQRLGPGDQVGDQQLVAGLAGRDGPATLVDDLDDRLVLEQVDAGVAGAGGGEG